MLWDGVEDVLRSAGAAEGTLDGTTLIDSVNAVEHGVGVLLTENGGSAAQQVAALALGARSMPALVRSLARDPIASRGGGAAVGSVRNWAA